MNVQSTPRIVSARTLGLSAQDLPSAVRDALFQLAQHGCTALLAGETVLNLLLARRPPVYEVATNAPAERLRRIFPQTASGAGGVCVVDDVTLSFTTFRPGRTSVGEMLERALAGSDGAGATVVARPSAVGTPETEARVRDGTVVALFYDVARESIVDYVGGLDDWAVRTIRATPGAARESDDPCVWMRLVRLAGLFDFRLADETRDAIDRARMAMAAVSPQDFGAAFAALLVPGATARIFQLLADVGLMEACLPELAAGLRATPVAGVRYLAAFDALEFPAAWSDAARQGFALACLHAAAAPTDFLRARELLGRFQRRVALTKAAYFKAIVLLDAARTASDGGRRNGRFVYNPDYPVAQAFVQLVTNASGASAMQDTTVRSGQMLMRSGT